jgi:hypothetical protein
MTQMRGNPDRVAAACPLKSSRPAHSSPSPKASGCRTARWWRPSGSSSRSTKPTPCSSSIAAARRRTTLHPPRASCRCRSTNSIERITWSQRSTPPVTSSRPQPWSASGIAETRLPLSLKPPPEDRRVRYVRDRLRTPPKVPCKERNKELAPFGRWCNPTVSASGEAPCPSRASSTRHCPRPFGFARLVRSPCASGRSRLRTAKNTSSWPPCGTEATQSTKLPD